MLNQLQHVLLAQMIFARRFEVLVIWSIRFNGGIRVNVAASMNDLLIWLMDNDPICMIDS